mgnify:CR=1 FL=1
MLLYSAKVPPMVLEAVIGEKGHLYFIVSVCAKDMQLLKAKVVNRIVKNNLRLRSILLAVHILKEFLI